MATGKVEFHEGAPREGYSVATNEEATKTTTYLALFFDWFYKEVSESERDMIGSAPWSGVSTSAATRATRSPLYGESLLPENRRFLHAFDSRWHPEQLVWKWRAADRTAPPRPHPMLSQISLCHWRLQVSKESGGVGQDVQSTISPSLGRIRFAAPL